MGVSGLWDEMVTNAGILDCLREQGNGASATTDRIHAIETWPVKLSSAGFTLNCCCVSSAAVFTLRAMNCYSPAAAAAKSLQSCLTLRDPMDGLPPGSPVPGILQARVLQLGCHCLLQCMKAKSKREVTKLCLTLSDPMNCSPSGSSMHGVFQAGALQ